MTFDSLFQLYFISSWQLNTYFQTVTVQEGEEEPRSTLTALTTEMVDTPPKKKKFMFICKISTLLSPNQLLLFFNSCSQHISQVFSVWSGPTDWEQAMQAGKDAVN